MPIKSKAWNWDIANAPWWEQPAAEVYPLIGRWQKQNFTKLLDLGCGVGRHSLLFAEYGFEVSAFDLGKEGVDKLEKSAKESGLKIETKIGDMLSLPYEDNYFDCLIAYHAIYHTDDIGLEKAISEIKRVLKPGGEALITFNSKKSTAFNDPDNIHITENTISKTKGHEAGIPHFYADKKQVEDLLKDFETLEINHKEEYWPDYTGAHYFILIKKK